MDTQNRANSGFHRRGAALILTLFALLANTGMGLVAINSANEEIQAAGNYKYTRQAEQVSAASLNVALGEVGERGDAYWSLMKQQVFARAAAGEGSGNPANIPAQYIFQSATLQPWVTPWYNSTTPQHTDADQMMPEMTVTMDEPLDGYNAAGYSQNFCFKRFEFQSGGSVGTDPLATAISLEDSHVQFGQAAHRAFALLGPLECEGN